jgi:hypothetical protein
LFGGLFCQLPDPPSRPGFPNLRRCLGLPPCGCRLLRILSEKPDMVSYFNRPPRLGSTDEAAQKLLRMLEREEREAAELKRLRETGWQAPQQPAPSDSADVAFGDGRDAIVDQVQSGIDHRNALRAEAQRRAAATATPAVGSGPPNGSVGSDDPSLVLVGNNRPATGGGRPPSTPYEMSPGLMQILGLGIGGALGVAGMSSKGDEVAARRYFDQVGRDIINQLGYYPPLPGSDTDVSTSPRTIIQAPEDFRPGKSPEGALAELEALIRPKPTGDLAPIDPGSVEQLIPPEIRPQDLQPGGYAAGSPPPKVVPLIREAWSPTAQELLDWLLSLNSKGSPETQRDVDYIAKRLVEKMKKLGLAAWHSHGGASKKEKYYAAEGRKRYGSGRSDATITIGEGEDAPVFNLNTGEFLVDKKTAVARERRAEEKLNRLQLLTKNSPYRLGMFPKQKGFNRPEWEETIDRLIDELLQELWGSAR